MHSPVDKIAPTLLVDSINCVVAGVRRGRLIISEVDATPNVIVLSKLFRRNKK